MPELETPAPPTPVTADALPPLIEPRILLVSVVIVPALDTPSPPVALLTPELALPPLIVAPMPVGQTADFRPGRVRHSGAAGHVAEVDSACGAAADRSAVGERLDRAGIEYPGAPDPSADRVEEGAGVRRATADRATVGQRRDRAGVGHAGAARRRPRRVESRRAARDRAGVGQHRNRAGVGHPGAPDRMDGDGDAASPPLIVPLLVSVVIEPELDTPAPPTARCVDGRCRRRR